MGGRNGNADPHVGGLLREARLARSDSLTDISRATCISTSYLAHVEAGDFGELPGEVYARGYIRAYALQVGLDPDNVLLEYDKCNAQASPAQAPHEEPALRPRHRSLGLWSSILCALCVACAVGVVVHCT